MIDGKRLELWEAINEYAAACGGNTSADTVSDRRMAAVVAIGRAIEAEVRDRIALRSVPTTKPTGAGGGT